jgi:Rod binding domain-containing protein
MLRPLSPEGLKQIPLAGPAKPNRVEPEPGNVQQARLMQACRDFEAIFLTQLLKSMRATVPKDGLLGESREQQFYHEMQDEEMANHLAASGGTGIAEALYRQLAGRLDAQSVPAGGLTIPAAPPARGDENSPAAPGNHDSGGLKPAPVDAEDSQ